MTTEQEQAETIRAAVNLGYQWLVTEGFGLGIDVNRVKVETLDIGHASLCVLGQATPAPYSTGYSKAMDRIFPGWRDVNNMTLYYESQDWCVAHGFLALFCDPDLLTQAWRGKLTRERAAQ